MKMRTANDLFVPKLCFSNHCFRNFVFFSVIRLIQFNRGFMPHFFNFGTVTCSSEPLVSFEKGRFFLYII